MSSITIIGTGKMACALGHGWRQAGHNITFGSRHPQSVTAHDLGVPDAVVTNYAAALKDPEVVLLAIPFSAVADFVIEHRDALRGKTIIDISNPFDALAHNEKAAAECTAETLGTSEGLVAAFKDNFAATINQPRVAGVERPDVRIASDDDRAKKVVAALAADLDHRVLDCGPLTNARYIDGMVSLMLILDQRHANGTQRSGWKFSGLEAS